MSADVPIALAAEAAQGAVLVQGGAVYRVAGGEAALVGWDAEAEGSVTVPGAVSYNGSLAKVTAVDVHVPTDEELAAEAAMAEDERATAQAAKPQIKHVTLPASIECIAETGLGDLPALRSVAVSSANKRYASHDGMLFATPDADAGEAETAVEGAAAGGSETDAAAEGWRLVYVPQAKTGTASVPAEATQVDGILLSEVGGITSIAAEAGSRAFAARSGLLYSKDMRTLVAAPGGATAAVVASECERIAEGAFAGCGKLGYVAVSGTVSQIDDGAFSDEAKAAVCVLVRGGGQGEAARTWREAGFARFMELDGSGESGDGSGEEGEGTLPAAPGLAYGLREDYTLAVRWQGDPSECPESLEVPVSAQLDGAEYPVAAVADGAFEDCEALESITLPASVERVGASAFEGTSLKSITLPAALQSVGGRAFAGCDDLSVAALGSVPEVAEDALDGCSGAQVYVPYSETGEYAWSPALGLPAAGNRVLPYGVSLDERPVSLAVGESAALYAGGEVLAPGDATVQVSYSAQCVSVDPEANQVTAKAEGSSDVTVTVLLGDGPLATGTRTVEISAPAAEGSEGGELPAAVADADVDVMSVDVPLSTEIRLSDDGTTQMGWGTFKSRNGNAVKVVAVSSSVQNGAASLFGDGAPEVSLKLMRSAGEDGLLAELPLSESTSEPKYFGSNSSDESSVEKAAFFIPAEGQADMLYDLGSVGAEVNPETETEFLVANLSYTVAPVAEDEEAPEAHNVTVKVAGSDDGSGGTVLQGDGLALPEDGVVSVQDGYSKTFLVAPGEGRELNSDSVACVNESNEPVDFQLAGSSITLPSVTESCTLTITFDQTPYLVRWMDGDTILHQEVAYYGDKLSAPCLESPEPGKVAIWYKDVELASLWDFGVDVVAENLELYVLWGDPMLISGPELNALMGGGSSSQSAVTSVVFGRGREIAGLDSESAIAVDVGSAGNIKFYRIPSGDSFHVYIICESEKMYLNPDSSTLLSACCNLEVLEGLGSGFVDSSRVTDMSEMFSDVGSEAIEKRIETIDLSGWNTSQVMNMSGMFSGTGATSLKVGGDWNTSSVASMSRMFKGSGFTNLDLASWDVSNVTDMSQMFEGSSCESFESIERWNVGKVEDMNSMFEGALGLKKLDLRNWKTPNLKNMGYMFAEASNLESLNMANWKTSKVTGMVAMFWRCQSLSFLDVSGWDTSQVTNMDSVFLECESLTSIDLSSWTCQKVKNTWCMFALCSSLVSIDLSGWNTVGLKRTDMMFSCSSSLTTVYVGRSWDISGLSDYYNGATAHMFMFLNCSSLKGGGGYGPAAGLKPPKGRAVDKTYAYAATSADPYGYFTLKSSASTSSIPAISYLSERGVA